MQIENLQIVQEVLGSSRDDNQPNWFLGSYETTIKFNSKSYPVIQDHEMLQELLELFLEIQSKGVESIEWQNL